MCDLGNRLFFVTVHRFWPNSAKNKVYYLENRGRYMILCKSIYLVI